MGLREVFEGLVGERSEGLLGECGKNGLNGERLRRTYSSSASGYAFSDTVHDTAFRCVERGLFDLNL